MTTYCPLHAPFPFPDLPLRAPLRSSLFSEVPLRSRSLAFRPAPLHFPLRSRSAHMLWCRHLFHGIHVQQGTADKSLSRSFTESKIKQLEA